MKIDPKDYMTINEAAVAIGADNKRAVYRAINRARDDGEEPTISFFGKTLVARAAIEVLKQYYFPVGSVQRHDAAMFWGSLGGRKKRENAADSANAEPAAGG